MSKKIYNIIDYYRAKAFSYLGIIPVSVDPNITARDEMYVNNINDITQNLLREYNTWYEGEGDKLLNLYTGNMLYEYQTEPLYDRNKRSYYWCVSATEDDIKRTHSGQPRNIVDTLVSIIGIPKESCNNPDDEEKLLKILDDNNFDELFQQEMLPRTLVEGWGAYKIDFDEALRPTPILLYYRANEVDFIYNSNQLIAIIYKNYYRDEHDRNFILFEIRRQERTKSTVDGKWHSNLIIEKELYELGSNDTLTPRELKSMPQLKDVEPRIKISDYDGFLGGPSIIYRPDDSTVYGRSIFKGKIDLFDDLDQCLSQSANTVRRSTTHVYINNQYLERDQRTGMPIMPSDYDCKYVMLTGAMGADGGTGGNEPVTTIQPKVDFMQYSAAAIDILVQIVSGIMSPATLGIDIAKKDNAEAQREKEKVTIFTKNTIIRHCEPMIKKICSELMCAQELMDTNSITKHGYDISVVFDEYADESFENKAETMLTLYNAGVLPPEMFVKQLFAGKSKEEQQTIIDYIESQKQMSEQMNQPSPEEQILNGQMGILGANNPYNTATEQVDTGDVYEDMGVPDMVGSASNMRK